MAKKKPGAKNVIATQEERTAKAVRLDLTPADYARLERCARRRGLTKASFARMAVLALLEREEAEGTRQ
jgi:hypothetical protein